MNVTANRKLFSISKVIFSHKIPLSKVQKTCVNSLKTLGNKTNMGTKTELVNNRNNGAAITASNIPNKRNINIGRSSYVS